MSSTPKRAARRTAQVLAGAMAVAFAAWAWNSSPINLRDRLFPKHLVQVYPDWLYRSGQISPGLIEPTLRRLGIDVVVDLTYDLGGADAAQVEEQRSVRELGIQRVNFPLGGSGVGAIESYVGAVSEIARAEREGQRVLVHCRAGDRRTGGVIAAYQLLVRGESVERAYQELGLFARKPLGESRLLEYLDENLPEIGERLQAAGVIEDLPEPFPRLQAAPESRLADLWPW